MSIRISAALALVRLGRFLQSLPVVILRPSDIADFNSQWYDKASVSYGVLNKSDMGLTGEEQDCLHQLPKHGRKLLIIGAGGGREVLAFGQQEYQITGVDFSQGMLNLAEQTAADHGISFQAMEGEISQLNLPENCWDVAWISRFLYSSIFTRQRRIATLQTLHKLLRKEGILITWFTMEARARETRRAFLLRKTIAWLTLGNTAYETGDKLVANSEIIHAFTNKEALVDEFTAGGFELLKMSFFDHELRGYAVLRSSLRNRPGSPIL